jgi:ribosomal-protein-serine acetyltransferase
VLEHPPYQTLIPLFDELRGERVIVRPYRLEDAPAVRDAIVESRDHLRPWMPFADAHQTVDETRDWLIRSSASWQLREDMFTGLWDAATGRYLGSSGLHPHNWQLGYFEIGYWVRVSAQGQGYVTEAVKLQTDFAFEVLHARRVEIRCDARNTRSAAVAERLGFVREARLRQDTRAPDGSLRDTLVFALIESDPRWPPRVSPGSPAEEDR